MTAKHLTDSVPYHGQQSKLSNLAICRHNGSNFDRPGGMMSLGIMERLKNYADWSHSCFLNQM